MEATMKAGTKGVWEWLAYGALAALGVLVIVVGAMGHRVHLLFGGAMLLLIAAVGVVYSRAMRSGRDDNTPSNAEKAAWSQVGMGLSSIMVLGGMALGSMRGSMASYLFLAAYALLVALHPLFRRRFIEENRRYREVGEDERDRAIRAQGDYLSKRLLELALVVLAIVWVLAPQLVRALDAPLQIASFLLLPVLVANVIGEARVARLHWQDRQ